MSPVGSNSAQHPRNVRWPDRTSGFTLVELLVVLAILVMIAMAMPALYSQTHEAMVLKTTTATLAQELRALHRKALAQGRMHQCRIAADTRGYQIDNQPPIRLVFDRVRLRFEPSAGQGIGLPNSTAIGESTVIRFFPDGSATGGRLLVENDRHTRVIAIDWLTGRVRIRD